jgi:hypothetical protein
MLVSLVRLFGIDYTLYVVDAVVPPRPVQLVWKNSPLGLSVLS